MRWAAAVVGNYDITIIDITDGKNTAPVPAGARYHCFPILPSRPLRSFAHCFAIARYCRDSDAIVNIHYVNVFLAFFSLIVKNPIILSFWGSDVLVTYKSSRRIARWIYEKALKKARCVTVNSAIAARMLDNMSEKIIRVDWPVDGKVYCPASSEKRLTARVRFSIPSDAIVLLTNRAALPIYRILDIARAYKSNFADDFRFFLIAHFPPGSDPKYTDECTQALRGIASLISSGDLPLDQRLSYYAAADFYLSFPESDSYPASLVEAAACGLMLVCAADTPSYDDIEKDFMMTRLRIDELKPSKFLVCDRERKKTAEHNFATIRRQFDTTVFVSKLNGLYARCRSALNELK